MARFTHPAIFDDTGLTQISPFSASYFSNQDQSGTNGSIQAHTLNNIDWEHGIQLVDNSKITFLHAGKYNIAFFKIFSLSINIPNALLHFLHNIPLKSIVS